MIEQDVLVQELVNLVVQLVKTRDPAAISLDELGELVGDRIISSAQIDLLIHAIEETGILVATGVQVDVQGLLRTVIQTALSLRGQGKGIGAKSIAELSGLSVGAVQLALRYADVLRGSR
jgi:hypothetical protein